MQKQKLIVSATVIGLLLAVVVLWLLSGNSLNSGEKADKISFLVDGEELAVLDKDFILAQESKTFPAVIRSSGQRPQRVEYSGVLLSGLLDQLGVDWTDKKQIIVKAVDGYVTALSPAEFNGNNNIYIAYAMNGEDLKPRSQGGDGPYQLVIPRDPFSQRWCKYVTEIEIK